MNEQLQSQLAEILKQMSVAITATKDISLRELPDIARQYIVYGFFTNLLSVIISGTFIIVLIVAGVMLVKYVRRTEDSDAFFAFIPLSIIGFPSIGVFVCVLNNLILNITAPKVWLILEIKNILS